VVFNKNLPPTGTLVVVSKLSTEICLRRCQKVDVTSTTFKRLSTLWPSNHRCRDNRITGQCRLDDRAVKRRKTDSPMAAAPAKTSADGSGTEAKPPALCSQWDAISEMSRPLTIPS
jgi:hypothetical protein